MATRTFGTDGVRGRAFDELTLADAFLIGRAAADVLDSPTAVIGRDTRESGPAIVAAVAAGLAAGGTQALDLGVAPTPAVAHVAGIRGCIGVVVSASHNPWYDNGVKLFSARGSKLSDPEQDAIELRLTELRAGPAPEPDLDEISLSSIEAEVGTWVRSVVDSMPVRLDGLAVVVDCANGAASHVVAPALADMGADVTVLANRPDGRNINAGCGSTDTAALAEAVVASGSDVGLAFDGDADRLVAVDELGSEVDGDQIMAMLAVDMHDRGALAQSTLVVTVMSNLGLLRAMDRAGIAVEITQVGDRHVLIALERIGANFGGEQSGHLIFGDLAGTGDGFLSGVQLLCLVHQAGQSLSTLAAAAMTVFPQVLKNVQVKNQLPDVASLISHEIAAAEAELGEDGRILVRASGTEPVVRVMVEAADASVADQVCDRLCDAVRALP